MLLMILSLLYDYDNSSVEQKTIKRILVAKREYGHELIAPAEEKQAAKALVNKWHKAVQENFKVFVGAKSCDNLSEWCDLFLAWCSRARLARAKAEST